jgi:hypothetical protein
LTYTSEVRTNFADFDVEFHGGNSHPFCCREVKSAAAKRISRQEMNTTRRANEPGSGGLTTNVGAGPFLMGTTEF